MTLDARAWLALTIVTGVLRVECFHSGDEATEAHVRRLATTSILPAGVKLSTDGDPLPAR